MYIRKYQTADCKEMAELFYNTVHTVNAKDYTNKQLDAWAAGDVNIKKWDESFKENLTLVAVENEIIIGFGDMDKTGYLDRLYVHKDYQRRGTASAVCDEPEKSFCGTITTHASITAAPFLRTEGMKL